MSDKMTKKKPLVPRLRFPEFQDAGEWEECPLKRAADFVRERIPYSDVTSNNYISTENILPEFSGVAIASSLPTSGTVVSYQKYDILAANIRPYLKKIWLADRNGGASNDVIVIRAKKKTNHLFLSHLLINDRFIDHVMSGVKGLKMPRGELSLIREYPTPIPQGEEQLKITECLSSLADLISSECNNLDSLKIHKKGLMQQLFPSENKTTPRLRFSRNQGDKAWKQKTIGQIATLHKGKGIAKSDISPNGICPCIRYGELYTNYGAVIHKVVSKTSIEINNLFLSKSNDVLIPSSGETKIDIAKSSCILQDYVAIGGDVSIIRSNINGVFLSYYINGQLKLQISKFAQGDSVVHLYPDQIKNLQVLIPNIEEQQKIARCLSSIDELIDAQSRKIELLKLQKKGLMQQLFPEMDEVTA